VSVGGAACGGVQRWAAVGGVGRRCVVVCDGLWSRVVACSGAGLSLQPQGSKASSPASTASSQASPAPTASSLPVSTASWSQETAPPSRSTATSFLNRHMLASRASNSGFIPSLSNIIIARFDDKASTTTLRQERYCTPRRQHHCIALLQPAFSSPFRGVPLRDDV